MWQKREIEKLIFPFGKSHQRPKLFRQVRHEGMEQANDGRQDTIHCSQGRLLALFVFAEDVDLARFDEPIAKIAPDKIV